MLTSLGVQRRISDLQVGESVLSMDAAGNAVFSEVLLFMDRDATMRREFVKLETDGGAFVTVTPAHLLMVWISDISTTKYTFADQVEEGHYLLVNVNGTLVPRRVIRISAELHTGVYAPLTAAGTIVVNSVTASCYALVDSQSVAHWSFMPIRAASTVRHWFNSNIVPTITHQTGIHWYAKALYSIKDYFLPSDWIYQT